MSGDSRGRVLTPLGYSDKLLHLHRVDTGIYLAVGPLTDTAYGPMPVWSAYVVQQAFAEQELSPVTLAHAWQGRGLFGGEHGIRDGWYCYGNPVETCVLAWDYCPFLYYVDFIPGLALMRPELMQDWISPRRWLVRQMLKQ